MSWTVVFFLTKHTEVKVSGLEMVWVCRNPWYYKIMLRDCKCNSVSVVLGYGFP